MVCKVHRIDLNGVNAYLIGSDKAFILFDTGGHIVTDKIFDNRLEQLCCQLKTLGCDSGNLKLVLLSHGDHDHSANAHAIKTQFQVPIAMHAGDLPLVESPTMELLMESFRYRNIGLRITYRMLHKVIKKATENALIDFTPFTPDIIVFDGMRLDAYGIPGVILHLPGHTPGSVGVHLDDGTLLAGDIFTNYGRPAMAANAVDFNVLEQSVQRLKALDISQILPGHGEPFAVEKKKSKFF